MAKKIIIKISDTNGKVTIKCKTVGGLTPFEELGIYDWMRVKTLQAIDRWTGVPIMQPPPNPPLIHSGSKPHKFF